MIDCEVNYEDSLWQEEFLMRMRYLAGQNPSM
jgi:hypothetical protein